MNIIRRNDHVRVISGKDKGKEGRVIKISRKQDSTWILIEGINLKSHYVKANPQASEKGGIEKQEAPILACKVALIDPTTDKTSRIGIRINTDGNKERYFKSSGETVRQVQDV